MKQRPGIEWTWNKWKFIVLVLGLLVWAFVIKLLVELL